MWIWAKTVRIRANTFVCAKCYIKKTTVNREIFNDNKFSRLVESTKNQLMKINKWWKFIRRVPIIAPFRLAQLIHVVVYLLIIVYGLLRYFKWNSRGGGLLNPTGPLPVFHHRSYYKAQKAKSKLSPIKNPCDRHVCNSLLNVLWIFVRLNIAYSVATPYCVLRTPYCILRNHADIHLTIINMVTDYTQYEVRSKRTKNRQ